jgi:hypothetical protein
VWHGGEPLTIGVSRFTAMPAPFEESCEQRRIRHHLQTNATLISAEVSTRAGPSGVGRARLCPEPTVRGLPAACGAGSPTLVVSGNTAADGLFPVFEQVFISRWERSTPV